MNINNGKKEEKGGFLSALSGLFGGGASSGMGTAGGLFATKAGIMGMVLGGATIAAGVGVVYNFVGSSSKPVYSPELFQNSYYEEESAAAGLERAQSKDRSSASASTLDIFRDQAKKDGLGGLAAEAGGDEDQQPSAEASAGSEAPPYGAGADPASAYAPGGGGDGGGARLQATPGFGGRGGGGSTSSSMPRIKNGGGLSGGIGGQFASMYQAPAGKGNDGRTSAMGGSMAARTKGSPKYAVPNFNKKGAHAQAKFANLMSGRAAASKDGGTQRTSSEDAFSGGDTTGEVTVTGGEGGAGLGGAGISNGSGLKGNDPNLSANNSSVPQPPPPSAPEDTSPWNKLLIDCLWWGLGAVSAIGLTTWMANLSKAHPAAYGWAIAFFVAALACIAVIVSIAIKLISGNGKIGDPDYWAPQVPYGIGILFVCAKLTLAAMKALSGATHTKYNGWDLSKPPNTQTTPFAWAGKVSSGINKFFLNFFK